MVLSVYRWTVAGKILLIIKAIKDDNISRDQRYSTGYHVTRYEAHSHVITYSNLSYYMLKIMTVTKTYVNCQ